VKAVRRTEVEKLQAKLRTELRRAGDPEIAAGAQAYMKSEMPYYGIMAPVQRRIFKEHFADISFPTAEAWRDAVLFIWRNAKFREERYFAISFCAYKNARSFQTPDALPIYEEMIVTGAWWDLVDGLHHTVGGLLKGFPKDIGKGNARVEPLRQYVEAANVDHLPAQFQERYRPSSALRLHRAVTRLS